MFDSVCRVSGARVCVRDCNEIDHFHEFMVMVVII